MYFLQIDLEYHKNKGYPKTGKCVIVMIYDYLRHF